MARKEVIVAGRDAGSGLSKDEEARAKNAMEDSPDISLRAGQGTDIPVTKTDPDTVKQRDAERKLEQKQDEFVQKQAEKSRQAAEDGQAKAIPIEDPSDFDWKPVKLLKGYTPLKAYRVMEAETPRIHSATPGRVLDKVQAGSTIELPADEARALVKNKLAERGDAF